jgi:hypothetical protein
MSGANPTFTLHDVDGDLVMLDPSTDTRATVWLCVDQHGMGRSAAYLTRKDIKRLRRELKKYLPPKTKKTPEALALHGNLTPRQFVRATVAAVKAAGMGATACHEAVDEAFGTRKIGLH